MTGFFKGLLKTSIFLTAPFHNPSKLLFQSCESSHTPFGGEGGAVSGASVTVFVNVLRLTAGPSFGV